MSTMSYIDNTRYVGSNKCLAHSISCVTHPPSALYEVTVINFTVTFDGLLEQLLSATVDRELPEVRIAFGVVIISSFF